VKKCQDLPGQELFQYQNDTGEGVKIDSADVNDHLREITQEDLTAKDFRTWHGAGHMAAQLAALGPADTQTAKRNIVAAVRETAKLLGNRPAACRKSYVHPALFESYSDRTIFATMQKFSPHAPSAPGELRPSEAAVLRLIESYALHQKTRGSVIKRSSKWVRVARQA
jgi:DNA topoisomerase I